MKISRFTDSQIMAILKENEAGASVPNFATAKQQLLTTRKTNIEYP